MPKKYYFLAPTFTINPSSPTAPKLGSIYSNLTRLTAALNQTTVLPVPPDTQNNSSTANFSDTISSSHGGALGINANLLQGIAGSGEVTWGWLRGKSDTYTCAVLDTTEFEPTKPYVNDSIAASVDVQEFLEDSLPGRKRVFMITGLKIATGFRHVKSKETSQGPVLKVGVDATAFGVPGEVGPQVELEVGGARETDSGVAANQVVFAYRVARVRVKRDGVAKWKFKSGGKYGVGDEDDGSDGEDEGKEEPFDLEEMDESEWLGEVPDAVKVEVEVGKGDGA